MPVVNKIMPVEKKQTTARSLALPQSNEHIANHIVSIKNDIDDIKTNFCTNSDLENVIKDVNDVINMLAQTPRTDKVDESVAIINDIKDGYDIIRAEVDSLKKNSKPVPRIAIEKTKR